MKTRKINDRKLARRIHLRVAHSQATAIFVAGTFNDWRPNATPLMAMADGIWAGELSLPPGSYEYQLVADGQWMPDPAAAKSVPNPFGGVNSVLEVPMTVGGRKGVPARN